MTTAIPIGEGVAELDSEVDALEKSRLRLMKARVVGGDRPAPAAIEGVDEAEQGFTQAGAIDPPYNPMTLAAMLEHSNSLRQNVDAYVTNVHAHGHHFEAIIDLKSDTADERIASLIFERRQRQAVDPDVADPDAQAELPTDEEVKEAKAELEEQMRLEKACLKRFFENVSLEMSFQKLRMITAEDEETLGNGYWEIVRSADGDLAQFNYIPAFTMRLMPLEECPIDVEEKVRVDDVTWGEIVVQRRMRIYVQVFETEQVYFKELGDPRIVSRKTGAIFPDEDTWNAWLVENQDDGLATEILHFNIHNLRSAYGVPRWIGNLLAVLGSRQVDEVNFAYFENKAVPPLAILVSGGRMTEEAVTRVQDYIDNDIKGKNNFHKVLILEAESMANPLGGENKGQARIELKPMTQAQHNDALFQKYDERNIDKVGMSFRLPRMLRGDIRDFNRATADAALEFAEKQVFAPLREAFDWIINRKILPRLGIRFWTFKSNSPKLTDPIEHGKMVAEMAKNGILVPAEAREEAEKTFNRDFRDIQAPWTKQPLQLTLAGIAPPSDDAAPATGELPASTEAAPAAPARDVPTTGTIQLTGTALASVVTVNEVRADLGLGKLTLQGGAEDPDGFLTVKEFEAKRTAAGEAVGEAEGTEEAGGEEPVAQADLSTGDLASDGGLAGTGARARRPKVPSIEMEAEREARKLWAMRKALLKLEAADAQEAFEEAAKRERASDDA